jgi:hypothetical protein
VTGQDCKVVKCLADHVLRIVAEIVPSDVVGEDAWSPQLYCTVSKYLRAGGRERERERERPFA